MAYGCDPELLSANPCEGAYAAVAEGHLHHRVCEAVLRRPGGLDLTGLAEGMERLPRGKKAYLTLQEYFEKLRTDPARWGKPFQGIAQIGGRLPQGGGALCFAPNKFGHGDGGVLDRAVGVQELPKSLTTMASEVQKGNAPEERKLQRLFRDPAVTKS